MLRTEAGKPFCDFRGLNDVVYSIHCGSVVNGGATYGCVYHLLLQRLQGARPWFVNSTPIKEAHQKVANRLWLAAVVCVLSDLFPLTNRTACVMTTSGERVETCIQAGNEESHFKDKYLEMVKVWQNDKRTPLPPTHVFLVRLYNSKNAICFV